MMIRTIGQKIFQALMSLYIFLNYLKGGHNQELAYTLLVKVLRCSRRGNSMLLYIHYVLHARASQHHIMQPLKGCHHFTVNSNS